MNTEPESPQITSAGDEKARLECEKLKAEINAINKPLVRTPSFYSAMAPVALAILGLAFSWWSGWFDVQRTRVSNEKTLLEAQTERLKTERTTLEAKAQEQQAAFVKAEGEIQTLKERESFLTNQLVRLERERTELRSAKDLLENETKRLAGSDAKATEFLEQLKSLQATREQLAIGLQTLQASNAALRTTCDQQVEFIRRASNMVGESLRIAMADKQTHSKFSGYIDDAIRVRVDSAQFLPEWQSDPPKTYEDYMRKDWQRYINEKLSETSATATPTNSAHQSTLP